MEDRYGSVLEEVEFLTVRDSLFEIEFLTVLGYLGVDSNVLSAKALEYLSDITEASELAGLAEPGARIRFDNRIELLRMSSAGVTPVDVFSTVFIIRCTMGNCS